MADDDKGDIPFFENVLGQVAEKVKITLARDERELLEFLKLVKPDIIVVNLNMPGDKGVECLRAVRSEVKLSQVPVLVYGEETSKNQVYKSYILGANLYIAKPRAVNKAGTDLLHQISSRLTQLGPQPNIDNFVLNLVD